MRAKVVQATVVRTVGLAATAVAPVVRATAVGPVVRALVVAPRVVDLVAMPADPIEAGIPTQAYFP